ncbi:septation protein A [Sneathiella chungangensis]|uniref:Inner membrane-spanning protein YciB n=1 Tax=Sneathiella chungangensis TaxID=1418234 RepID=A0A845MIT2_9PROT|nr:septation protein A [Sneathiella chungangensis]MZR23729.1 septation protein A [Sneathiella chungangensis]
MATGKQMPKGLKPATELGPIAVFFAAYYFGDLFVATGAIMITTVIALAISYYYTRTLPMMPMVTAVVVMVFGGLTLYLNDETFIKMKPTIIYGIFAAVLFAGILLGKSFVKVLFDNFWNLDDSGWHKLTIRLGIFFLLMAVANEIIWRNVSTELWVNIKVFGFTAATFLFFIAQVPMITRHMRQEKTDPDA